MTSAVNPIIFREGRLDLLDQRLLPHEIRYVGCHNAEQVAEAIRTMVVRGAPAIGVCAAFGIALEASAEKGSVATLRERIDQAAAVLAASRPTAVNLAWAIERMRRFVDERLNALRADDAVPPQLIEAIVSEAVRVFDEDLEANHNIGRFGAELLSDGSTVLTHCNAGALATAGYGTALGVIRGAIEQGKKIAVFADETRPYLQGARLTAWELLQDGIDVTLITDNMSGHFFRQKRFDAVVVGADRIAANGDTANKIGTYMVAVLAQRHEIPFYVAAPVSTIDAACPTGEAIPIEERSADEVPLTGGWTSAGDYVRVRTAPDGIRVAHPAFDVTPAELITAIITDRGILRAPFSDSIREILERSK